MNAIPTLPGVEIRIPISFARLYDLAYNLWSSWDVVASNLWSQIDAQLWQRYRNPIELLAAVEPSTWEALAVSSTFTDHYAQAVRRFDAYMNGSDSWYRDHHGGAEEDTIAYLSAEFGSSFMLPLYSGGLGVLAGDHVKSASDLGLPFIGCGLLYRRGYFHQEVDSEGHQQHIYPQLDVSRLPIRGVASPTGGQLKVPVDFPGRTVRAAVWALQVGRVTVLLLDTDLPENDPADRPITATLYVRGREMRFCQEMVLGFGAVRALDALQIKPSVWHVNEGHAALSLLERLAREVFSGVALAEAEERVRSNTVFTLHTPVPAGNEVFDFHIVEKYLSHWPSLVGADTAYLGRLGSPHDGAAGQFNMSALAIRLASFVNGVSQRHGEVVSRDWGHLIGGDAHAITNGIHSATWVGRPIARVIARSVGTDWEEKLLEPVAWQAIRDVPDADLWEAHMDQKRALVRFARGRIRQQLARQGASPDELRSVEQMLPPERLTIGFARRFASYKRATLLFKNEPWLQSILTNPERPVQIVFAGKAHPADRDGQALIRHIVEISRRHDFRNHLYFIEDYDMRIARFLVQGVDLWLNTPRPPLEASGTSGMKAALNGALNMSILDGWWVEGFNGKDGWTFGMDWGTHDHAAQDGEDAIGLYRTLQDAVAPLYYDRDESGLPRGWIDRMKEAIAELAPRFSTHRMVVEYAERAYERVRS